MRLARILSIIFSVSLLLSFTGCKDDDPVTRSTFRLAFDGKVGNEDLVIDQIYTDPDGRKVQFTMLKYYISDLRLIKADNTEVLVKDVELIDFDGGATFLEGDVDVGDYKGYKFGLGVSPELNAMDPSTFPNDHPLGVFALTYWTWATQYRFALIEGRVDPSGVGNVLPNNFVYHTGTNDLYRSVEFPDRAISVAADAASESVLTFDALKIFYGDTETIDYVADSISHTTDALNLAVRVTDNLAASFN